MDKEREAKIPIISVFQTPGLTSIQQLINTTSNEIFSFGSSSSATETISLAPKERVGEVEKMRKGLHGVELGGIWKGIEITDKDIKEVREELLKKLEEKW